MSGWEGSGGQRDRGGPITSITWSLRRELLGRVFCPRLRVTSCRYLYEAASFGTVSAHLDTPRDVSNYPHLGLPLPSPAQILLRTHKPVLREPLIKLITNIPSPPPNRLKEHDNKLLAETLPHIICNSRMANQWQPARFQLSLDKILTLDILDKPVSASDLLA